MFSELLNALVAVLSGVCFFLLIVIAGMTRTIIKVKREGRFNAKDRRKLINSIKYITRSICVREATALIRDYFDKVEKGLPEFYVKKDDDEYEKYELNLVDDHIKSIRVKFEQEMLWAPTEDDKEYDEQLIAQQTSQKKEAYTNFAKKAST